MGNTQVRKPNTSKTCKDCRNDLIKFGQCEMQGWRTTMVITKLCKLINIVTI